MEMQNWLTFASIALVATITPGPAVLLVVAHSLQFGRKCALFTILGNISALFVLSLLSVLGQSVLIHYSEKGFVLLKSAGVLFLVYLGLRLLTSRDNSVTIPAVSETSPRGRKKMQLYLQGLLVALSNPKAIGFTTALFPQFINNQHRLTGQFAILVVTFMALSFLCLFSYAMLGEQATGPFTGRGGKQAARRVMGFILIASGVGLGLSS